MKPLAFTLALLSAFCIGAFCAAWFYLGSVSWLLAFALVATASGWGAYWIYSISSLPHDSARYAEEVGLRRKHWPGLNSPAGDAAPCNPSATASNATRNFKPSWRP